MSRNSPTVATDDRGEHVRRGCLAQHDGLDERREHDEEAGDERRVRCRRALQPRVLEPVADERDDAERQHRRREHPERRVDARASPRAGQGERREHDRADREPQQDEADRRDALERVLHEHERAAVRRRRRDQRELGQQRSPRVPRCSARHVSIAQPGQRLVIGSRRSLPNALGDTRTPGGPAAACTRCGRPCARRAARARRSWPRASSSATERSPST